MQLYFAMVDESETTFTDAMKREDLTVYDLNWSHSEGDFSTLVLTIQNPRVGLLNSVRKQWLWFAVDHPTAGVLPKFFGRIEGVPEDLDEDYVRVTYIAKSSDFEDRKTAAALAAAAAPFWDPIWFNSTQPFDPDNVLEFRPALWYISPTTHDVSYSNIIEGEDGNLVFGEDKIFFDSLKLSYGERPLTSVTVHAQVSFDQKAKGTLDVTSRVLRGTSIIETYTGEGLSNGWPKVGDSFGGGWSVAASSCVAVDYSSPFTQFEPGYAIPTTQRDNWTPYEYFTFGAATFEPHGGLVFVKTNLSCNITLGYDVTRRHTENLTFTLYADVQPIISDIISTSSDTDVVSFSSSELNQPIDAGGLMPLRDERASAFFSTDRGDLAIQSLLALGNAKLLARARCVDIDFEVPPLDALAADVTLRKSATITDHRLPGAVVAGKITDFSFQLNGDDGDPIFQIKIKSTPGKGSTVTAVPGEPEYAETDYCDDDYQAFDGSWVLPALGDVVYQPINGQPASDDGLDFYRLSAANIVTSATIHNPASVQEPQFPLHGPVDNVFIAGTWSQYYLEQSAIQSLSGYTGGSYRPDYSPSDALKAINDIKTTVEVHLKDITNGPFETAWNVPTSDVVIPRLIDLESSSTP